MKQYEKSILKRLIGNTISGIIVFAAFGLLFLILHLLGFDVAELTSPSKSK